MILTRTRQHPGRPNFEGPYSTLYAKNSRGLIRSIRFTSIGKIVSILIILLLASPTIPLTTTQDRIIRSSSAALTPLLCIGASSLCADFEAVPVSLLSTTFRGQSANSASPSYTWDFGDGTTGSGNPVTHTYTSSNEYLVKLTVIDGSTSFSVDHYVTELDSLPANPFTVPSSASINPNVSCKASVTTIPGIIGSVQNPNGGADIIGARTTSMLVKHTLNYPCSLFGYSVFVELHNVTVSFGPYTTTDCTNFPSAGSVCDVVGNLADGTGYMHAIRWEIERHWSASGEEAQFGTLPRTNQHLDVQGFTFWSFLAPADATHDYSGWYLELTAWRPSSSTQSPPPPSQQPPVETCHYCSILISWALNDWILLAASFLFGLSLTIAVGNRKSRSHSPKHVFEKSRRTGRSTMRGFHKPKPRP